MRVLHIADLHILLSGPRAGECRRVIDWIALNAKETRPDAIVIPGDLSDRRMTPRERLYFAEFLCQLRAIAPVIAISGNHDDPDDLRLFRKEYGWVEDIQIHLEPGVVAVGGVALGVLPWPDLGILASKAGESIAARREIARGALIDILRGFSTNPIMAPNQPSLLIAHLPVTGASMDSGQPVSGGDEIALTADELLESGAAGVALGHIHLRQQMRGIDGRPVFYAGAPFRGSFGEAKGTKGGLIWDWDARRKAWKVEPWEVPARPMVLLERTWLPAEEGVLEPQAEPLATADEVRDADVRIRISFPAESREAMREALAPVIDAVKAVANSVVVEERAMIVSRTRCVEITAARTTREKLQAWAQAVGVDVPAGAGEKLSVLEQEIRS